MGYMYNGSHLESDFLKNYILIKMFSTPKYSIAKNKFLSFDLNFH